MKSSLLQVLTSQRYSDKADVYSFSMVVWETITRKLPYSEMTAMQAGMGVATLGLRPEIPASTPPGVAQLIRACWAPVSDQRPSFAQIVSQLEQLMEALDRPPPAVIIPSPSKPGVSATAPGEEEQGAGGHSSLAGPPPRRGSTTWVSAAGPRPV